MKYDFNYVSAFFIICLIVAIYTSALGCNPDVQECTIYSPFEGVIYDTNVVAKTCKHGKHGKHGTRPCYDVYVNAKDINDAKCIYNAKNGVSYGYAHRNEDEYSNGKEIKWMGNIFFTICAATLVGVALMFTFERSIAAGSAEYAKEKKGLLTGY